MAGGGGLMTAQLPTVYEHYTSGGIASGLSDAKPHFTLNDRFITLYSGAVHYFRVPPEAWRDRLRKARAAGLNAVETYVPWNLHEPQPGVFEFGSGESGSDHAQFLDLQRFLKIAQEEDLLAIVRPGPYICGEFEFGGLPSWLLREPDIQVRTTDEKFMKHVTRYFNVLLTMLAAFQFTNGGPIIAFQIENEFGNFGRDDQPYLYSLKELMDKNGIKEMLFTSDPPYNGDRGALPGILRTANFQGDPDGNLWNIKNQQYGKPVMAMEYWTGWFDHWSEEHHTRSDDDYEWVLRRILEFPASVNLYMFLGGTNFGFLNGANIGDGSTDNNGFQPTTTSYDYDAPLNEAGDYTEKYYRTRKLIKELNAVSTHLPSPPPLKQRMAFPNVSITEQLLLIDLENAVTNKVNSPDLLPMELLPINNNTGQQYGYIVYKKTNVNIPPNSELKISGRVCDTVMVLINGVLVSKPLENSYDLDGFGYWRVWDSTLNLGSEEFKNATLELVVENWGRNNFGWLEQFKQLKGLWQGPVSINNEDLTDWEIIPLEFRTKWTNALSSNRNWRPYSKDSDQMGPALYRAKFTVSDPTDTFIDMRQWTKGIVIVNGFVLGRHAIIGPQYSLYLPESFLKEGENELLVFEHFKPASQISFAIDPIYNYN